MKLYWSARQIPELAALTRKQRRRVVNAWWAYHRHTHPLESGVAFALFVIAVLGLNRYCQHALKLNPLLGMVLTAILVSPAIAAFHCVMMTRLAKDAGMIVRQMDFAQDVPTRRD